MDDLIKYKLFFGCMKTIGGSAMGRLLSLYENEKTIYKLSESKIMELPILTLNQKREFCLFKKKFDLDKSFDKLKKLGINFVTMNMPGYPARLTNISNRPYRLFYYGELPKDDVPSVAVIGTRKCSIYGEEMAALFSSKLAKKGIQIVSGLASGIDGIAQKEALASGGQSFGVLGSGVDICYPNENKGLYNELKSKGGVISEFAPGTAPLASNFPVRNRIISGLADLVLVVEAKEKSGTVITVNMALEQGRDVFAIPGRCLDSLSYGCNRLISEGAGIAYSVDVVMENIRMSNVYNSTNAFSEKNKEEYKKSDKEKSENDISISFDNPIWKAVVEGLSYKEYAADELYVYVNEKNIHMSIEELKIELMKMELEGIIKARGGVYAVSLYK